MAGSSPTPPGPTPTPNYSVYGNPTIENNIFSASLDNTGCIYTPQSFNPPSQTSWTIQTKIKVNSAVAWKNIWGGFNPETGGRNYSILTQSYNTSGGVQLFLSANGTSWNVTSNGCRFQIPTGNWYVFQLVCEYDNGSYKFKQGLPELESWSAVLSKTTPPIYNYPFAFGLVGIDADLDLTETKIWIGGSLWWEAITQNNT